MPLVKSAVNNLPTQEEMSQGFVQLVRLNNQQDIYNYIVHLMDIDVPSEQILTQLDNHYYLVQERNEVFRQALKQLDDTGRLKVLFGIDNNYSQEASQRIMHAYIYKSVELSLNCLRLTSIPNSICRLTNLQQLNLSLNQLSSLPESIGQLTNLQELNLCDNQLSSLSENICQLANLQELDLNHTGLSSLPESICQLTNLRWLRLEANHLSSLPESIRQLANLQWLDLAANQLSSLPESICHLTNLRALDLLYNQLSSLPESIGQLTNLQSLDLNNNQLSSLPESIGQLTNLQWLNLHNNQLSSLPESIGQLASLNELNLDCNQISSLPECICLLTNLEKLYLGANQLSSLPESICQLTNLQCLALNNNQFSSLPESICPLTNLHELYLGVNQLSLLPESIGLLTNLQHLDLLHNRFSIDQLEHIRSLFSNTRTRILTGVYEEPRHTARNSNAPANVPTDIPSRINYLKQLAGNHNITKNWSNPSIWAETEISQNVHFKTFLDRIWEMRDAYSNEENLKNMLTVLINIFAKMESNPEYRGICLQIAEESLEHCGDRIAFGLIQMQIAEKGYPDHNPTLQELFNYEKMCAKVSLIREIAHARIENSHGLIDEIEVYLKYFKDLKTEIDINIGSMLYERLSDLTPQDIENARQQLAEITDDDIFKIMIDNPKVKEILRQEFEDIMSKPEYAETFQQEGETDLAYKTRMDNMKYAWTQDMVNALKQNILSRDVEAYTSGGLTADISESPKDAITIEASTLGGLTTNISESPKHAVTIESPALGGLTAKQSQNNTTGTGHKKHLPTTKIKPADINRVFVKSSVPTKAVQNRAILNENRDWKAKTKHFTKKLGKRLINYITNKHRDSYPEIAIKLLWKMPMFLIKATFGTIYSLFVRALSSDPNVPNKRFYSGKTLNRMEQNLLAIPLAMADGVKFGSCRNLKEFDKLFTQKPYNNATTNKNHSNIPRQNADLSNSRAL